MCSLTAISTPLCRAASNALEGYFRSDRLGPAAAHDGMNGRRVLLARLLDSPRRLNHLADRRRGTFGAQHMDRSVADRAGARRVAGRAKIATCGTPRAAARRSNPVSTPDHERRSPRSAAPSRRAAPDPAPARAALPRQFAWRGRAPLRCRTAPPDRRWFRATPRASASSSPATPCRRARSRATACRSARRGWSRQRRASEPEVRRSFRRIAQSRAGQRAVSRNRMLVPADPMALVVEQRRRTAPLMLLGS